MIDVEKFVLKAAVERDPLIRTQLIALRMFGYVLFDNQKRKRLHCLRGVVFSFSFILFNATQFVDLFQKLNNIDEMTKNAPTTLLFATTSFRMVNFYWNRRRYVQLIESADDELRLLESRDEDFVNEVMSSSIKYQRRLTMSFWIIALITGNMMCIYSAYQGYYYQPDASSTAPPMILPSWFPFDQWRHFWIIYAVQYYIMNIGMLIVPCWHSLIVSIMILVILKLKILNHELSIIGRDSHDQLVTCVNEREKLFEFVRELESLMSSSLFLDFVVFSILLCTLLFQATQVEAGVQLAIIFFYILTMTTILWMYYHHANEITFYSDKLTTSAYKCSWYDSSRRFKKELLLFLTSTKPIKLRAGFIEMRLDTFLAILRASYSYFTLLTNIASD